MSDCTWQMLIDLRGGHPEKCDFCDQPYTDERHPEPEEAGMWACSECMKRWHEEAKEAEDE